MMETTVGEGEGEEGGGGTSGVAQFGGGDEVWGFGSIVTCRGDIFILGKLRRNKVIFSLSLVGGKM